jgi:hypothetical protein
MARSRDSRRGTVLNRSASRPAMLTRLGFRKPDPPNGSDRRKPGKTKGGHSLWARLRSRNPLNGRFAFPSGQIFPALAVAVLVALAMAALRVDLIRGRYEIGMGYHQEEQLNRRIARLTASMRELRDPARLGKFAKDMGFVPPERLIDLPVDLKAKPSGKGSTAIQFARHDLNGSDLP